MGDFSKNIAWAKNAPPQGDVWSNHNKSKIVTVFSVLKEFCLCFEKEIYNSCGE